MELDKFVINSEEPFVQVLPRIFQYNFVFPSRNGLAFFLPKYTSGSNPPTHSPHTVAKAAPARPQPNTAINKKSRIILVTPASTITVNPNLGLSAVTKKHWNTFCSINAGMDKKIILPYKMQLSSNSPVAPSAMLTCFVNKIPIIANKIPPTSVTYTISEKYSLAFFFFPSPSVLATIALPPVPIINPCADNAIINGIIRFNPANAVFPT